MCIRNTDIRVKFELNLQKITCKDKKLKIFIEFRFKGKS